MLQSWEDLKIFSFLVTILSYQKYFISPSTGDRLKSQNFFVKDSYSIFLKVTHLCLFYGSVAVGNTI